MGGYRGNPHHMDRGPGVSRRIRAGPSPAESIVFPRRLRIQKSTEPRQGRYPSALAFGVAGRRWSEVSLRSARKFVVGLWRVIGGGLTYSLIRARNAPIHS